MTELSPVAQAVLDAFLSEWNVYAIDEARWAIAAAFRAAVDQYLPAEDEDAYLVPWNFTEHMRQRQDTRRKFLAIAAELGGTNNTSQEDFDA